MKKVRAYNAGEKGWSVTALQSCTLDDPAEAKLPKKWYERKIGVRMNMLGEKDTTAYTAQTPLIVKKHRDKGGQWQYNDVPSEVGGVTIIAERNTPATTFVALHEPFEGDKGSIVDFRKIGRSDRGFAVAVIGKAGSAINDRLMLCLDEDCDKPLALTDGRESFTFTNWAYLRIGRDKVEIYGDMRAARLSIKGKPKLLLNGNEHKASFAGNYLSYGESPR